MQPDQRPRSTRPGSAGVAPNAPDLVGRQREFDVLATLVDRGAARGAALVVHGDPGVGKSALLAAARQAARARGCRVGDLTEILAATSVLASEEATHDVLDPAVAARLVVVGDGLVEFRHPLVRSGVLQSETVARRQAANAAMADVLVDEPYRGTWHRAQSIVGPDDRIADELAANVAEALRRGGVMSAIADLECAAQLTCSSAGRGHRLLLAAEHAFSLGGADIVNRLVQEAARTDLSELDQARMEWLREIFNDGIPGDATRVFQLCGVADRSARAGDLDLALNLLLGAALAEPVLQGRPVIELLSRVDPHDVADADAAPPVQSAIQMGRRRARSRAGSARRARPGGRSPGHLHGSGWSAG